MTREHFDLSARMAIPSPTAAAGASPKSRSSRLIAVGLGLLAVTVYRFTDRELTQIDMAATSYIPLSILHEQDIDLDEFAARLPPETVRTRNGRVVSWFPVWPAFQLLPVYALYNPVAAPTPETVWRLQRRAAQIWMAVTVIPLYLLLERRTQRPIAVLLSVAFSFGSINWFVLSQLYFSNGPIQLFFLVGMCCLYTTGPLSSWRAGLVSCCAVAMLSYRLNSLPIALAWFAWLAFRLRRRALLPLLLAACLAAAIGHQNYRDLGHPLGMYGLRAQHLQWPSPTLCTAVYGNLCSPARGLLLFSPWVILTGLALARWPRSDYEMLDALHLAAAFAHFLLTSNHWHWFGGNSMGPRLTADALPLWTVLSAVGLSRCRARAAFDAIAVVLVLWSVVISCAHAFSDSENWAAYPVPLRHAPERLFDWHDPFIFYPFLRRPYEDRYPIPLLRPLAGERLHGPACDLAWVVTPEEALTVELLAWNPKAPDAHNVRVTPQDAGRVRVDRSLLTLRPECIQLAWRVLGRGGRRSAWRTAYWDGLHDKCALPQARQRR